MKKEDRKARQEEVEQGTGTFSDGEKSDSKIFPKHIQKKKDRIRRDSLLKAKRDTEDAERKKTITIVTPWSTVQS